MIYLLIPIILLDLLFSKIFNYIPKLNLIYKEHAAKIDLHKSIICNKLNTNNFKPIKISDITNKKLRRSLRLTFRKWYVYQLDKKPQQNFNVSDSNRYRIYISRDKLTKKDYISGERISDFYLSKNYNRKRKRLYLKFKGIKNNEFYKLEPQLYVICAKKSHRHDKLKEKSKIRIERKKNKKLTKQVKKAIKNDDLYSRISSLDSQTPLNLAVENNRYDLIEKILKYAEKIGEKEQIINYSYYWDDPNDAKKPLEMVQNKAMIEYLKNNGAK